MTVQLTNTRTAPKHDVDTSRARKSFFAATHLAGLSLLLNVISVPVLAYIIRNLGASGYGQWATAASLVTVASALTSLGLRGVFVRGVARDENSAPAALADQLGVRMILCSIATLVVIGTCFILRYPLIIIECAAVASLGMFLTVVASTMSDLLQGLHKINIYASANFIAGLALTAASVFVIRMGMGPVALSAAYLCGPLVGAVILIIYVQRELFPVGTKWNLRRFWQILKDSKFFAAQMITNTVSINAESLIAPRLVGSSAFGLFSAGMTLASRLMAIPDGVSSAFYPVIAQAHAKDPKLASKQVMRALVLTLLVCVPAAVGVTAFALPVAKLLFHQNVEVCRTVICITIWALPLIAIENLMGYALNAAKKDAAQARMVFISANASLVLSIILIAKFGVVGASWSYMFRAIVRIACLYRLFKQTFPMKLPVLRVGTILASASAMAVAMWFGHHLIGLSQNYTMDTIGWLKLLVSLSLQGALGMGIYGICLVGLRVVKPADIMQLLKRKRPEVLV